MPRDEYLERERLAQEQARQEDERVKAAFHRLGWSYRGQGFWSRKNQVLTAHEIHRELPTECAKLAEALDKLEEQMTANTDGEELYGDWLKIIREARS